LGRLISIPLLSGIEHQLAQVAPVRIGKTKGDILQEIIVSVNERIPPLFELSEQLSVKTPAVVDFMQRFANGLGIDRPHDGTDVLHLPAPGLVFFECLGKEHGFAKVLIHLYLPDLIRREAHELLAKGLESQHISFDL
jgi:hypothetical protein